MEEQFAGRDLEFLVPTFIAHRPLGDHADAPVIEAGTPHDILRIAEVHRREFERGQLQRAEVIGIRTCAKTLRRWRDRFQVGHGRREFTPRVELLFLTDALGGKAHVRDRLLLSGQTIMQVHSDRS